MDCGLSGWLGDGGASGSLSKRFSFFTFFFFFFLNSSANDDSDVSFLCSDSDEQMSIRGGVVGRAARLGRTGLQTENLYITLLPQVLLKQLISLPNIFIN